MCHKVQKYINIININIPFVTWASYLKKYLNYPCTYYYIMSKGYPGLLVVTLLVFYALRFTATLYQSQFLHSGINWNWDYFAGRNFRIDSTINDFEKGVFRNVILSPEYMYIPTASFPLPYLQLLSLGLLLQSIS